MEIAINNPGLKSTRRFSEEEKNLPKILIVDDEPEVYTLLSKFLSKNYCVDFAGSCKDAFSKIKNEFYEVAIVDINFPDISGREFINACKELSLEIEIIVTTGAPEYKDAVNFIKNGAYDYITKPFDLQAISETIAGAVKEQKINAEKKLKAANYKIVRKINSGSSGIVFLVEKNGIKYAMKILKKIDDEELRAKSVKRFKREIKILTTIEHPGVVKIIEYNLDDPESSPYIVMEYVKGEPLSRLIKVGGMSINDRLADIRQIADILAIIHKNKIIHRDVKPENIIINETGNVKITDFGISRLCSGTYTFTEDIAGSPLYMAPESFDATKDPGPESDVFSLGIVAYELITGKHPFEGESIPQISEAITRKFPARPSKLVQGLPLWVEDMLAKMIAKKPSDRLTAPGIVKCIDHYLGGSSEPSVTTITAKILKSMLFVKRDWS